MDIFFFQPMTLFHSIRSKQFDNILSGIVSVLNNYKDYPVQKNQGWVKIESNLKK